MRIEHWEKTTVRGWGAEGADGRIMTVEEEILHRRGTDPLLMACKRNRALAAQMHFTMETEEAFTEFIREEGSRRKEDIPRDRRNDEEWDW